MQVYTYRPTTLNIPVSALPGYSVADVSSVEYAVDLMVVVVVEGVLSGPTVQMIKYLLTNRIIHYIHQTTTNRIG